MIDDLGLYPASISHLVCHKADAWRTMGHCVGPLEEQFELLCLVEFWSLPEESACVL